MEPKEELRKQAVKLAVEKGWKESGEDMGTFFYGMFEYFLETGKFGEVLQWMYNQEMQN